MMEGDVSWCGYSWMQELMVQPHAGGIYSFSFSSNKILTIVLYLLLTTAIPNTDFHCSPYLLMDALIGC